MRTNEPFRHYLLNELEKRGKKNNRFSVRAFAKQLKIEPSSLAQILAGKRNLTPQMCQRLSKQLALSPVKLRSLMKHTSDEPLNSFPNFKRIEEDQFKVISDWHYYAILELTRTDSFQSNLNWIANALDITTAEASTAIERLKRLGYLSTDSSGRYIDTLDSANNAGNETTSAVLREHQKQILGKAIHALDKTAYEERVQSSIVLVGDQKRLAQAKQKILNFMEELDDFMKSGPNHDEVYSLSVSLFPISNTKKQNRSPV